MTIQLVADNGRRENSHPSCEGRSDVRRIYLRWHKETLENLAFLEIANLRQGAVLICPYYCVFSEVKISVLHV